METEEKSSRVGEVSGQLFSTLTPLPDAVASLLASSIPFVGATQRS